MNEEFDEELEQLKKVRTTLEDVCNQLTNYEKRVRLHTKAIGELQTQVLIDREALKVLVEKIENLEKKQQSDVMYG